MNQETLNVFEMIERPGKTSFRKIGSVSSCLNINSIVNKVKRKYKMKNITISPSSRLSPRYTSNTLRACIDRDIKKQILNNKSNL